METQDAVRALAALAHESRLNLFRLLVRCGPSGMAAGDIAKAIEIGSTALSFHLKELDRAGLLRSWREGRYIRYAVRVEGVRILLTYLTEDCCGGNPELCGGGWKPVEDFCCVPGGKKMINDEPYNVLFLCTHNSSRSVIGECLMNALGQGAFKAYSAGSTPRGEVNPFAVKILKNQGHDTTGLRSKSWDEFAGGPEFDFVLTLCDEAAAETCPVWPGNPITEHWGMSDPSRAEGSDGNKLAAFANTYSLLHWHITKFMNLAKQDLDGKSMRRKVSELSEEVRRRNAAGLAEHQE